MTGTFQPIFPNDNLDTHLLPGLPIKGVPSYLENSTVAFNYNDYDQLERIVSERNIGVIVMEVERNMAPQNDF